MVADDEKLARLELEYYLKLEPDINLLPSACNGPDLLQMVEIYHPEVIFLDIHMPELKGTQVAAQLNSSYDSPPLIVFCTAFEQYAVEAFGLNVIDYLLKPFEPSRFKECIRRVEERVKARGEFGDPLCHSPLAGKLFIEENGNKIILSERTILFAEKEDKYLSIHTIDQIVKTKMSIQRFEKLITGSGFIKMHRSYLVNVNYISELRPWMNGAYNIVLKGQTEYLIPVPRTAIKEVLKKYNHLK